MKSFTIAERYKLIISLRKSNIYQLNELKELICKEIARRKCKESKELKKC